MNRRRLASGEPRFVCALPVLYLKGNTSQTLYWVESSVVSFLCVTNARQHAFSIYINETYSHLNHFTTRRETARRTTCTWKVRPVKAVQDAFGRLNLIRIVSTGYPRKHCLRHIPSVFSCKSTHIDYFGYYSYVSKLKIITWRLSLAKHPPSVFRHDSAYLLVHWAIFYHKDNRTACQLCNPFFKFFTRKILHGDRSRVHLLSQSDQHISLS